jgi:hypothetical protein
MITNIKQHLQERGLDFNVTNVILDEVNNYAVFLLYNLSGKLVGYQNYNPNADKIFRQGCSEGKHKTSEEVKKLMRYYTYTTKIDNINELSVYGLETLNFNDEFIFLTEGIFDIIKIHNQGFPGIAILGSDPKSLTEYLNILPQKKIVIYEDDASGRKLKEYGNYAFTTPFPFKDLGEMNNKESKEFINKIMNNVKK